MATQTGSLDLSTVFSNNQYTEARIETKVNAVPGAGGLDLVSNINAIADQINLFADYIRFSSLGDSTVYDEIGILKQGVIIDTTVPSITIGDIYKMHVVINGSESNNRLSFMNGTTEVAYMTGDKLYIPSVVVVNSMQAGNWLWDASVGNHLTLKWSEEVV